METKSVRRFIFLLLIMLLTLCLLTACGSPGEEEPAEEAPAPADDVVAWPDGGESGFIPVDGGEVWYRIYGKDQPGTPLIFLHGGPGGSSGCFFKQMVLAEDRPVVVYNQLGSAGSSFSEDFTTPEQAQELLTIEHFVDEVQTVVDYLGFDEFILVGRSWGTMLAVEYAAAKQPEGLKGIVLNGPFLSVETWIDDAERLIKSLPDGEQMWETIVECESSGEYTDAYDEINTIYSKNFGSRVEGANEGTPTSEPTKHKIDGLSVYNYMWGPSEFSCTGTLQGHDSTPLLASIDVPILYIAGQYDSGSPEAAFYYNSLTPNGEVCILPGSAHNTCRERPDEFNAVVKAFAERVGN